MQPPRLQRPCSPQLQPRLSRLPIIMMSGHWALSGQWVVLGTGQWARRAAGALPSRPSDGRAGQAQTPQTRGPRLESLPDLEARFRENSEAPGRGPGAAQWRSVALAAVAGPAWPGRLPQCHCGTAFQTSTSVTAASAAAVRPVAPSDSVRDTDSDGPRA